MNLRRNILEIFNHLEDKDLIVAHDSSENLGTLYELYLKDIHEELSNGGYVLQGYDKPIILMIDMNSNGSFTIKLMNEYFEKYFDIINNQAKSENTKPVTVILSGYNKINFTPFDLAYLNHMECLGKRYVGIDGRLGPKLFHHEIIPRILFTNQQ